ncbi:FUSC family protein [Dactylosporangium darangshiense]|uniref:FUSC family protein n=1 Tax=Dactylosporangium darangshiense TaxID=579108 RepID=A0ABP8CT47_9ACTN
MHWWRSLVAAAREGLRVQRAFSAPWAIARAVLAVLLATLLGLMLNDPSAGAMASIGAYICAMATLLSSLRHRVVNALAMAAAYSGMAVLGALVHGVTWLFLPLLAVAAFTAGMLRTLGVAPSTRACFAVMGLMITGSMSPSVHAGLLMAGWIAVGTALAIAVQLLPPYDPRFAAQRRALAEAYRSLSAVAGTVAAGAVGSTPAAPTAPFIAARQALDLLPQFSRPAAAALFGLLGEAERIRRTLHTVQATAPATDVVADRAGLQAAARVLDAVSRTVASGREHRTATAEWTRLEPWAAASPERSPRDLVARLREAEQLARRSTEGRLGGVLEPHAEIPGLYAGCPTVARTARRVRAQLHPQAPIFRHAVRLAVGVVIAELIGQAIGRWGGLGIPGHGFWVALATMLVLFPEYGQTVARGLGRAAGALLGGLLAWALSLPDWSPTGLAAASVVLASMAFLTRGTGQLMLNLWLTAWIVFLLHRAGALPGPTAWARAADTVVGAALAVLIFLAWPTWSNRRLPDLLAQWLRLQDRLLPQLVTGYASVGAADPAAIDELRARTRQAREQLQAAVRQSHTEPAHHLSPWSTRQLDEISSQVSTVAGCSTLLLEHLPRTPNDTVPELTELADPLHEHLAALARAAAGAETVTPGALRSAYDSFAARSGLPLVAADSDSAAVSQTVALCTRTVDAVEDLTTVIAGRWCTGRARGR